MGGAGMTFGEEFRCAPVRRGPPPYPPEELVRQALNLIAANDPPALQRPDHPLIADAIAAIPSSDFRAVMNELAALRVDYVLSVRCKKRGCDGGMGRWHLDTEYCMALVYEVKQRGPSWGRIPPLPWTEKAVKGIGGREGPNTSDGKGTYTATCPNPRCARRIQCGPTFRTRMFLEALFNHETLVKI